MAASKRTKDEQWQQAKVRSAQLVPATKSSTNKSKDMDQTSSDTMLIELY